MQKPNRRIKREDGKETLKKAGFTFDRTCGQAELWFNKHRAPALVAFFGMDPNFYDAASLDNAILMKDDTI